MAHRTQVSGKRGDRLDAVLLCALVAVCAAVLAGFAWTRATVAPATVRYTQSGAMSYRGSSGPTSVYGSEGLRTGQPIYFDQISTLEIAYHFALTSSAHASLKGTEQLVATVASGIGISRTIPLEPVTSFHGDAFSTAGTLSLQELLAVTNSFASASGARSSATGNYTVTIAPNVHVDGVLGLAPLKTSFDPAMKFRFRSDALTPVTTGSRSVTAQQFQSSTSNFAPLPGGVRARLIGLPVWDLRIGALVIVAGALVGATMLGLPLLWEATSEDERVRINRRYGSTLVEVEALPSSPDLMAVDLASFDGLRQVARRLECPILRRPEAGGDVYAVVDNGTLYRYSQPARPKSTRAATGSRQAVTTNHSVKVTNSGGRPS